MSDIKRILVVDDEEVLTELVRATLSRHGYRVDSALDGWSALELIEKEDYDAILTDIRMPGLDGLALYRRLAEDKPGLLDRIIFMTGVDHESELAGLVTKRDVPILQKPFFIDRLLEVTRSVFGL